MILVNKQIGETPLEALERARVENGILADVPMTYAGRLDPMAEGLLLILVGDECKKKEEYLGLNKVYEVEVLFGFATDTGDLLGKVEKVASEKWQVKNGIQKQEIQNTLKVLEGKFVQEYPTFSSKTVDGMPLFAKAKSGSLPEILPTKDVEIYDIELLDQKEISSTDLLNYIQTNVGKVKGDFRQEEILKLWKEILEEENQEFQKIKIRVFCSSGTYMRSLATRLGEKLGIRACAFSIKRTQVGEYCM